MAQIAKTVNEPLLSLFMENQYAQGLHRLALA